MALLSSPLCKFGKKMPEFELRNIDGKLYESINIENKDGILIFFICNHCPYVKAIIKRLVKTIEVLQNLNIECLAIMPNDTNKYPEDNFENMKKFAEMNSFSFPYLIDSDQNTSKKFEAVCTPDFFGYNKGKELQYRGRLSEIKNLEFVNDHNDLLEAMRQVLDTGKGPEIQYPSSGCSIKWKNSL